MVWIIAYFNTTIEPLMWKYNTEGDNLDDCTIAEVLDSALKFFHEKYPQLKADPTKEHRYEYCLSTKHKWRREISAWTRLIYSNAPLSHFVQQNDDAFEIKVIPRYAFDIDAKHKAVCKIIGYSAEECTYASMAKKFWVKLETDMFHPEWKFDEEKDKKDKEDQDTKLVQECRRYLEEQRASKKARIH
jgi:hypothetical protein